MGAAHLKAVEQLEVGAEGCKRRHADDGVVRLVIGRLGVLELWLRVEEVVLAADEEQSCVGLGELLQLVDAAEDDEVAYRRRIELVLEDDVLEHGIEQVAALVEVVVAVEGHVAIGLGPLDEVGLAGLHLRQATLGEAQRQLAVLVEHGVFERLHRGTCQWAVGNVDVEGQADGVPVAVLPQHAVGQRHVHRLAVVGGQRVAVEHLVALEEEDVARAGRLAYVEDDVFPRQWRSRSAQCHGVVGTQTGSASQFLDGVWAFGEGSRHLEVGLTVEVGIDGVVFVVVPCDVAVQPRHVVGRLLIDAKGRTACQVEDLRHLLLQHRCHRHGLGRHGEHAVGRIVFMRRDGDTVGTCVRAVVIIAAREPQGVDAHGNALTLVGFGYLVDCVVIEVQVRARQLIVDGLRHALHGDRSRWHDEGAVGVDVDLGTAEYGLVVVLILRVVRCHRPPVAGRGLNTVGGHHLYHGILRSFGHCLAVDAARYVLARDAVRRLRVSKHLIAHSHFQIVAAIITTTTSTAGVSITANS